MSTRSTILDLVTFLIVLAAFFAGASYESDGAAFHWWVGALWAMAAVTMIRHGKAVTELEHNS